jgi:hypothetical protein
MQKMWHVTNRGPRSLVGLCDGYGAMRVKRQGRDVEHSPPPSAGVRNMWSYATTPLYIFMTRTWTVLYLWRL